MTQQLRAFALVKDFGLVPGIHVGQLTMACNDDFGRFNTLLWPPGIHICAYTHRHTRRYTYIHIKYIFKKAKCTILDLKAKSKVVIKSRTTCLGEKVLEWVHVPGMANLSQLSRLLKVQDKCAVGALAR